MMRPAMCGSSSRSTEAIGRRPRSTEAIGRRTRTPAPTGPQRFPMIDSVGDERSREEQTTDERSREEQTIYAVVVTHRRPDELAKSLDALTAQTRTPDHLVVVDNDFANDPDERVRDLVAGQPIPSTYLGSRRNL